MFNLRNKHLADSSSVSGGKLMEIFKFICKRTLWSLVALVGLSIIIFTLSRVVPGDPARMALGPRATEEAVQALRSELKLDQPMIY